MGEALLLLGEEVKPDSFVDDRIDLLALDQQGASVIIELKRGSRSRIVPPQEGDMLTVEREAVFQCLGPSKKRLCLAAPAI